MTIAQQALNNHAIADAQAIRVQFFTRCSIYDFADGSRLTLNLYGPSYAA